MNAPIISYLLSSAMAAAAAPLPPEAIQDVMKGKNGAFVLIDCASVEITDSDPAVSGKRLPPCSTFKIWNALLGIEEGILTDAAEPFYQWDGVKRSIDAWNKNLNLRDAFQASCVPAFQALARRIGPERMNLWLDALDYGNKNTRAGIDVFWLPAENRATLLISPKEQARLLCKLARDELPVKPASIRLLKQLMEIHATPKGTLYGKTGSGSFPDAGSKIGWFVGLCESDGTTYAFATCLQGKEMSGMKARRVSETILKRLDIF
jgi:beta-lactamase class D